jgi:hypothetical protein
MWYDPARDAPADRLGDEMVNMLIGGLVPALKEGA